MIIFKFSAPTPKFSSLNWVLFRPNFRITHCYFQTSKGAEILKIELLFKSKSLMSSFCACVGTMLKRGVCHWKVEIHVICFLESFSPYTQDSIFICCVCMQRHDIVKEHLESSRWAVITSIKQTPKFEYGICPMKDNQMAAKMAAACCVAFVDTLSKKYGKDQETIQSSTTPDPGYHMGK